MVADTRKTDGGKSHSFIIISVAHVFAFSVGHISISDPIFIKERKSAFIYHMLYHMHKLEFNHSISMYMYSIWLYMYLMLS